MAETGTYQSGLVITGGVHIIVYRMAFLNIWKESIEVGERKDERGRKTLTHRTLAGSQIKRYIHWYVEMHSFTKLNDVCVYKTATKA